MIQILGRVSIEDLPKFISVFATRGAEMRKKHGCLMSQVFKMKNETNRVVLLFDWESKEAFEGFLNDPMVKETMKSGGTLAPPEFTFLEKVAEFPS
jgi:quinol monooxygenase YgiN